MILIGRFQLGFRMVKLFAAPDSYGGSFTLCPKDEAEMVVGIKDDNFDYVHAVLCHEAWEAVMHDLCCAYKPNAFEPDSSDVRHFFFNHNQHTEICSRASYFLRQCEKKLFDAHTKHVKKRTKLKTK